MRLHYKNPGRGNAHVEIFYRNAKYGECGEYGEKTYTRSHVGLGVNARLSTKVLRRAGIECDAFEVTGVEQLREQLTKNPPTHAILEAVWFTVSQMQEFLSDFPATHFIVRLHSKVGFLAVEPKSLATFRDLMLLAEGSLNLTVAANSHQLRHFFKRVYTGHCMYLPNLYDIERVHQKRDTNHHHRKLRIGSFGALRLLKNHSTAASAALVIAERRRCDLEFFVSVHREEHGSGVLGMLHSLFDGVAWAKLVEHPWEDWPLFRRTVAHMDLCMQVSFTETFNICCADAVAEGVPVVTSDAIEWVPKFWHADSDSVEDIARVGMALLSDPESVEPGREALVRYCDESLDTWLTYLDSNPVC